MSALVTGLVAALIVVTGLSRRRTTRPANGAARRRSPRRSSPGIAILGAVVAIAQAYGDLRNGERALRRAASALEQGDIPVAVEQLDRSNKLLEWAADALDRPWARPALALPVIGQHFDALVDIGHGAVDLTDEATASVAQVNVESLRFVNGVIDIDAIRAPRATVQPDQRRPSADVGRTHVGPVTVARGAVRQPSRPPGRRDRRARGSRPTAP